MLNDFAEVEDLDELIKQIPETRIQAAMKAIEKILRDLEKEVNEISEEMAEKRNITKLYDKKIDKSIFTAS